MMRSIFQLLFPLTILLAGCSGSSEFRPNIIIVTFDTTRADHMSCYGYSKQTTPQVDALAADGLTFEKAYAVTSWTLPSHASIFTGKLPSAHGARYAADGAINLVMDGGIKGNDSWSAYRADPLAQGEITLAEILSGSGYATGGVVGGPWLKRIFGLAKGFQSYDDKNFVVDEAGSELNGRSAEDVTRAAIEFIDSHAEEPFFLFVNYYDPHSPYTLRDEYLREFWSGPAPASETRESVLALYDSEIRYTDEHFGRLIGHLRDKGLYEEAWIIVTADHGELMGENQLRGHGNSLSQPEIQIPLIVKEPGPERPKGRSSTMVQQTDIMPTILDRLGLERPRGMQGNSLESNDHPIVAEVYPLPFMTRDMHWRQVGDWKTLVDDQYKYVHGSEGRHLLFDLERDPYESKNIIEKHPEVASRMKDLMQKYFASLPAPGEVGQVGELDAQTIRELQEFGYTGKDEDTEKKSSQDKDAEKNSDKQDTDESDN